MNKRDYSLLSAMALGLDATPREWLFFCTMPGLPKWVRETLLDEFRACPRVLCLTPREKLHRVTERLSLSDDPVKKLCGDLLVWARGVERHWD